MSDRIGFCFQEFICLECGKTFTGNGYNEQNYYDCRCYKCKNKIEEVSE